jgi:methanogenic corrinoid protein MtbC1
LSSLTKTFADLDEKNTLNEIQIRLNKGDDPEFVLLEIKEGLKLVGTKFNSKQYALIELEMADLLYSECVKKLNIIKEKKNIVPSENNEKTKSGLPKLSNRGRVD